MANKLPPLPVGVAPGSGYWNDWYEKLRTLVNSVVDGLAHNSLTGLQGGSSGQYYHLTAAELAAAIAAPEWTDIKITTDTTVSGLSTIFSFTPAANSLYEVEGQLWLTSSSTGSGPQPGVSWNSGNSGGVAFIETTETTTTTKIANLPNGVDGAALATSFPDTTNAYPAQIKASFKTGATPSGTFDITLTPS